MKRRQLLKWRRQVLQYFPLLPLLNQQSSHSILPWQKAGMMKGVIFPGPLLLNLITIRKMAPAGTLLRPVLF